MISKDVARGEGAVLQMTNRQTDQTDVQKKRSSIQKVRQTIRARPNRN